MSRPASIPGGTNLPPWLWPRAAYLHVPFCAHHCGYCDFAVVAGRDHIIDRYLAALEAEIALVLATPFSLRGISGGEAPPTPLSRRETGGGGVRVPRPPPPPPVG